MAFLSQMRIYSFHKEVSILSVPLGSYKQADKYNMKTNARHQNSFRWISPVFFKKRYKLKNLFIVEHKGEKTLWDEQILALAREKRKVGSVIYDDIFVSDFLGD